MTTESAVTNPGGTDLAQTSLTHGFFFESPSVLSLSEHDANMEARSTATNARIDFHNLEVVGRLNNLGMDTTRITDKVIMVEGAAITQVVAMSENPNFSGMPIPFQTLEIAPGLFQVDMELTGSLNSTKTFLLLAEHSQHEFGHETHHGAVLTTDAP